MIVDEETYLHYEIECFLEHHGVKGMHWGVTTEENSSNNKSKMSTKKKIFIGLGSAAVVASIAVGAIYVKKRLNVKITDIPKNVNSAKNIVEKILQEPTTIMHLSKTKNTGFRFIKNGGVKEPISTLQKLGIDYGKDGEYIQRIGRNKDNVFAQFLDPEKRRDYAGRIIPHIVVLPKDLSKNVNTLEDAKAKAWPLIKDDFEQLYNTDIRNSLRK